MGKSSTKTSDIKVVSTTETPTYVVGSFFNGMQVPQDTSFSLYQHQQNSQRYVLHGENDTLEYNGDSGASPEENDYVVALYDPKSKSVELYRAPVIPSSVTSLSHRVHKGPKVKSRGQMFLAQRKALGEAFGTKKAKAAIENSQRNRIDSEKLQESEMDIVDNVTALTAILPSREQLSSASAVDRPTPVADEAATAVENVYPLENIVPAAEWTAIRANGLMEAPTAEEKMALLPFPKSAYIEKYLSRHLKSSSAEKVRMVYYASLLLGVYNFRRSRDKTTLMESLGNRPAEALVDGVLDRFAVSKRTGGFAKSKDKSFTIDPFHEDKLLCHLLALLFHMQDFALHVTPLSHELNMKPMRLIGLFRALGAAVKPVPVGIAADMGLSKKDAASYKIAVLKVPFKLPEMIKRHNARR